MNRTVYVRNIILFTIMYMIIFAFIIPSFITRFAASSFYDELLSQNPIFNHSFQISSYTLIISLYTFYSLKEEIIAFIKKTPDSRLRPS